MFHTQSTIHSVLEKMGPRDEPINTVSVTQAINLIERWNHAYYDEMMLLVGPDLQMHLAGLAAGAARLNWAEQELLMRVWSIKATWPTQIQDRLVADIHAKRAQEELEAELEA